MLDLPTPDLSHVAYNINLLHWPFIIFCQRYLQYCNVDSTPEPLTGPKFGRLVNHSRKYKNCKVQALDVNGEPRLCLFAITDIAVGEELLFDYGVPVPWPDLPPVCEHFFQY